MLMKFYTNSITSGSGSGSGLLPVPVSGSRWPEPAPAPEVKKAGTSGLTGTGTGTSAEALQNTRALILTLNEGKVPHFDFFALILPSFYIYILYILYIFPSFCLLFPSFGIQKSLILTLISLILGFGSESPAPAPLSIIFTLQS